MHDAVVNLSVKLLFISKSLLGSGSNYVINLISPFISMPAIFTMLIYVDSKINMTFIDLQALILCGVENKHLHIRNYLSMWT